jgi:hypothetical protein
VAGILVFRTIGEAQRAGFEVYDRIPEGYLVRMRRGDGWALALVELRKPAVEELRESELLR